jgi:hypothetical protein
LAAAAQVANGTIGMTSGNVSTTASFTTV